MRGSANLWVGFRMCRVVVFALATILSMALSVIYAVLLIREWKFYNDPQRAVVVIILVINGLSTILLYLMIIVRFRLWLDGARVAFLVLFQSGATVTFAIFNPSLPCNNLGTVQTCKTVSSVAIYGGWSLTALVILYAFGLAIMSHVPQPPPPRNPEESLRQSLKIPGHLSSPSVTSSTSSRTWVTDSKSEKRNDEKRRSYISDSGSEYSEISWIGSYTSFGSRATTPRPMSPFNASRGPPQAMHYGVYRPNTPQSIRSPAASSTTSNPLYPANSVSSYNSIHHRHTPQPLGYHSTPATPLSPPRSRPQFLPNPFLEPVSRSGTPASVASFHSDGFLYAPHGHVRNLTGSSIPPALLAGGQQHALPPPYNDPRRVLPINIREGPVSPSPGPELALDRFNNSSTPFTLQPGVPARNPQEALKSPGAVTVISHSASIRVPPHRRPSLMSVPRSPSPYNFPPRMGTPVSPRAPPVPTHPQWRPVDLRGVQRFHEVRRFGSSPDLRQGAPSVGVHRYPSAGSTASSAASMPTNSSALGNQPWLPDPRQRAQVRFTPK